MSSLHPLPFHLVWRSGTRLNLFASLPEAILHIHRFVPTTEDQRFVLTTPTELKVGTCTGKGAIDWVSIVPIKP